MLESGWKGVPSFSYFLQILSHPTYFQSLCPFGHRFVFLSFDLNAASMQFIWVISQRESVVFNGMIVRKSALRNRRRDERKISHEWVKANASNFCPASLHNFVYQISYGVVVIG